jgi:trimeric autotransporter adhesin
MRGLILTGAVAVGVFVAGWTVVAAQNAPDPAGAPPAASSGPASQASSHHLAQPAPASVSSTSEAIAGGHLHGVVKSGNIPLPGVTVVAQNTLTGKRYSTTTDVRGVWSLVIPQNGRYVVRTQFAAFAQQSGEAVLNAAARDHTVDFQLILASRAAEQEQLQASQQARQGGQAGSAGSIDQAIQQMAGNMPENLSLISQVSSDTETGGGSAGQAGAELPTVAANTDFSSESVAISGQSGQVSPLAGVDIDRLRDALETYRAQNGGQMPGSGGLFGGEGGGGFGGGGGGFGGGGGGFGGGRGGFGGGGGGRGNFRGFNPAQPHGAIFWTGNNSALNALPFPLRGQEQIEPPYGANRFGATLMTEPYIPGLTKPSGKDTVFFTLSGQRSSSPDDFYATVPTVAERGGDFSAAGLPAIYNPITGQQFVAVINGQPVTNAIPASGPQYQYISPQALALLSYFPLPNIAGTSAINNYNYHLLTTAQTNTTQAGIRYNRSLGANATQPGGRGGFGGGRRGGSATQGLRQSINFNYNWAHSAADDVNMFPQLGGKNASESNSVQAGYTVGYHRVTSIFTTGWNRSNSHTTNFFTNTDNNAAGDAGIVVGTNQVPLNYGLPNVTLSNFSGLNEVEPNFSLSQTISASETLSWIHGKHNLRFGGDYRRVHRDFLAGLNATGSFTFTGLFTESASVANSGSALADFLLGLPQSTGLNSAVTKSYLRDNVYDAYAMDDWRVLPYLTLNYGLRYEFYAPYTEKYGRLGMVDTDPDAGFTEQAQVVSGAVGPVSGLHLPASLVYPWRKAFAPRVGLALRLPKQTVLRAGFGMNYTVGEYATFANTMAHQPPFVDEQTNVAAVNNSPSTACVLTATCFTLANGFPSPATVGNYALDPHYGLPYVQTWNLDVQKTLPLGIVMNLGYIGSKADHMDMESAPRALPNSPLTNPTDLVFNYDQPEGFYKMSAGTVRVNKRLAKGISMGANYEFAHAIDASTSVNGTSSGSVAQNWQDLAAEEGNSSLQPRNSVSGTYLYELPFGEGRAWATSGVSNHILEGFSVSGTFSFASGDWLTPTLTPTSIGVTCGTAGSLRANRVPGTSVSGGGSLRGWLNPAAFSEPSFTPGYCNAFGTASRNSIEGPGTVQNNMSLSKTAQMGETRSMEIRGTIDNVFNTVQYSGVNTTVGSPTFGQVSSVGAMRSFQFMARFRF